MSLALTEEHLALADSVRGWAGHTAPPTAIRSVVDADDHGAAVYRDALRPGLAAQGLLGLHLPEALGGQGYGLPELAVATEELGRAMVPGGFLPRRSPARSWPARSPAVRPTPRSWRAWSRNWRRAR